MNKIKAFTRDRDAALLALDRRQFEKFLRKWCLPQPRDWIGDSWLAAMHKARLQLVSFTDAEREVSRVWLAEHGYTERVGEAGPCPACGGHGPSHSRLPGLRGRMNMAPTRPVMRYHGGKWRLASWVISHFPPHLTYVEMFGGSAAVLLQKPRARSEIYNDRSCAVVRTFRTIREHPAELARALILTPYARSEYETLYQETDDDIEAARRFIARSFMGQNSKGAFRRSGFDSRNNDDHFIARVRSLAAVPEQLAIVAGRLQQVLFENCDAIELVHRHATPETLLYAESNARTEVLWINPAAVAAIGAGLLPDAAE
jgi:hypothetical protein